jgi:DnaK suppressor protein
MATHTHSDENRAKLGEMLLQLQRETHRKIEDYRRDLEQESDAGPADSIDAAETTEEVETHAALISGAEEKLRYLDEALTRLEDGRYGICLGCRLPIPIERLRAVPFAAYCVDCQETRNRRRADWAQGTMIEPYDHQWTLPEEMEEAPSREYHSTAVEEQLEIQAPMAKAAGRPRVAKAKAPAKSRTQRARSPRSR